MDKANQSMPLLVDLYPVFFFVNYVLTYVAFDAGSLHLHKNSGTIKRDACRVSFCW
jgi:hypothetical protein